MPRDNVSRIKRPSPLGTSLFIGLRCLDPFLQYGILARGLASPILSALSVTVVDGSRPVAFGLPLKSLIILAMAVGSSIKQSYNLVFLSEQEMLVGNGIMIPVFNTVFNSLNSIMSLTAVASAFTPSILTTENENGVSPILIVSSVAYLIGILTEGISEQQRKNFKSDAKNAGKPFTGGLFGLARHINYGAYTVWRGAYALLGGGWMWGTFVAGLFATDFIGRGVPVLDEYCTQRYGVSWAEYKKKVPYKLYPGIY